MFSGSACCELIVRLRGSFETLYWKVSGPVFPLHNVGRMVD